MFNTMNTNVCAIIVGFNPNLAILKSVIDSLETNVSEIFLFDNSSDVGIDHRELYNRTTWFTSGLNTGIASAQNFLIHEASKKNYDYILVSDQDTLYPSGFVKSLLDSFSRASNVAAVCPGWLDMNLEGASVYPGQFIMTKKGKLLIEKREDEDFEISHAISSGMIINVRHLHKIGLMCEDLFIDWVDNEWCWRARDKGYAIVANPRVKVSHKLGDATVKVFGKSFVRRNNLRNYYIVRNAIYLLLHKKLPYGINSYLLKKIIQHTVFSLLAADNSIVQFKYLVRAYSDGINAKLGIFN